MSTRTVANTASELVPNNASRKSIQILNEDGTDSVFIKREENNALTVSSTDHDWKLGPGGGIAFNSGTDGLLNIQARYTIISSANTPRVAFYETEDIRR